MNEDALHRLLQIQEAFSWLMANGWERAEYCPRDVPVELLEIGSVGVHRGYRDNVGFWIIDDETYPSTPFAYRRINLLLKLRSEHAAGSSEVHDA